ncbi:MAG: 5'-methylthioadenosine/S-adenosylhomocysteine nucleosidase, partial [Prevotella sp.]|nr:5'-methylthioadenosine/S-adenosylhomocysteine nucleosidase [Prevotella sp.]
HRPDCIISSGCAGGNGDDIEVKDVVVSTQLAYHDVYCGTAVGSSVVYGQVQGLPARFDADPYLLQKAKEMRQDGLAIHPGLIVTGDWFVDSREKMRSIIDHFPEAKAVDMESAAIAHTCHLAGVPFISFRVVSDVPLRDTQAQQYHDFWAQVAAQSFLTTRTFVESL